MPQGIPEEWMPMYPDPRVDDYPLMQSFWPTALISLAYVVGVWVWVRLGAPKKSAKSNGHVVANGHAVTNGTAKLPPTSSFNLIKCLMVLYNLAMVMYSAFVVVGMLSVIHAANYGLGCVEFDRRDDEIQRRFIRLGYLFYFSKFLELLDTLFFLLRGKYDQVTFLHVFHHGAMPPSIWWGIRYAPGGIVYMFPLANSFVHVVMYAYYGMAALGLYRYLWWKKYLTVLQMVQFCIFIVHQGQVLTPLNWDCRYPKVFPLAIVIYAVIFLVLFGNFYVQAYWRKRRLAKRIEDEALAASGHVANGRRHKKAD
ncbi:unnamed protein product [Mesocestoides corti]|uniref:Elongation of very long chain fatty acids protein n=1 Tax=Mesocestoides corti TaxID=53468 RepID=A0A0R3UBL7_MESCO|nr:unnamed protein product [Mesocestoides corti]